MTGKSCSQYPENPKKMDKQDIKNDIDDLNVFVGELGSMIAAIMLMEAKYMERRQVREPLNTALASLKSATVDLMGAADQLEGMTNG